MDMAVRVGSTGKVAFILVIDVDEGRRLVVYVTVVCRRGRKVQTLARCVTPLRKDTGGATENADERDMLRQLAVTGLCVRDGALAWY